MMGARVTVDADDLRLATRQNIPQMEIAPVLAARARLRAALDAAARPVDAPRDETCGPTAHGFECWLPKGHNMGQADVPENHSPAVPRPDREALRERLVAALDVWEVFTADDGYRSMRAHTPDELADAVLAVLSEEQT